MAPCSRVDTLWGMAVVGVSLQVLGIALILTGGFRAASDMGAVERWVVRAGLRVRVVGRMIADYWRRYVLRKRSATVRPATIRTTASPLQVSAHGSLSTPWEGMTVEEKVERLNVKLEGLRELVDRNEARTREDIQGTKDRLADFESTVEERFEGHDARDESILLFELLGGVVSLFGTVLVWLA